MPEGEAIYERYGIEGTPTELIVDATGAEVDWHAGYFPPPEDFLAKLELTAKGIDTFKALSDRYAGNPKDAQTVFKLALKLADRWEDKALEKWKEGIALDPSGASGSFVTEPFKQRVTYTEYAEYQLALARLRSDEREDPLPLKDFIKKYPQSELLEDAYMFLAWHYSRGEGRAESKDFFEEYVKRYPHSLDAPLYYLRYIVRKGGDLERGTQLAGRLDLRTKYLSSFGVAQEEMADFYLLKGDKLMAEEVYGPAALDSRTRLFASDLVRYADFWAGRKENLDSARKAIDTALQLAGEWNYILTMAGDAYIKLGSPDKALAILGPDYAKSNWDNASNLWSHANFWAKHGSHLDEALASANRVVELAPKDPTSWDVLGAVLAKQKKYSEALGAAEKAVALASKSDVAYFKSKVSQLKAAAAKEKK